MAIFLSILAFFGIELGLCMGNIDGLLRMPFARYLQGCTRRNSCSGGERADTRTPQKTFRKTRRAHNILFMITEALLLSKIVKIVT